MPNRRSSYYNSYYDRYNSSDYLHESLNILEYQEKYELHPYNLEFKNGGNLGQGYFGVVREGVLDVAKQWKKRGLCSKLGMCKEKPMSVAVKIAQTDNEEELIYAEKMLYEELKIMCAVGLHPNIVTLVGAVTQKDTFFVVVEKCGHRNLLKHLQDHKHLFYPPIRESALVPLVVGDSGYLVPIAPTSDSFWSAATLNYDQPDSKTLETKLTLTHLLSYAWQVANGMEHLSTSKCVHRDLAARNILIGSNGICKVTDFGMARNIVGTEYYRRKSLYPLPARWMAPESKCKATVQSDVWSYGILLYEIFTLGGLPYNGIQSKDVFARVESGERNPKPSLAHQKIYTFMMKCWSLNTLERPSFGDAVRLMHDHLSQSSRQFYEKCHAAIVQESKNQQHLAELRNQAKPNHSRSASNCYADPIRDDTERNENKPEEQCCSSVLPESFKPEDSMDWQLADDTTCEINGKHEGPVEQ